MLAPPRRLRALDLFCKAGGAGMGLHRAGFDVVGVDIEPQKNYPFTFLQGDVLKIDVEKARQFDLIWASPPCQAHTALKKMHNARKHIDFVPQTRALLKAIGKPYIIENVVGAPLIRPITLYGTMFGLRTPGAELRRHRLFETSFDVQSPCVCRHGAELRVIGVYGGHGRDRRRIQNTQDFSTEQRREAMGISWMNGMELSQAIPPAYSQYLAEQFLKSLCDCQHPETTLSGFAAISEDCPIHNGDFVAITSVM